mmetsp:Transcript_45219/g.75476  ORF Transcript_45219/g.75476 Transcript_45219/m.75476 type:complete len:362 (-) Transcript_45219:591-1676(-)
MPERIVSFAVNVSGGKPNCAHAVFSSSSAKCSHVPFESNSAFGLLQQARRFAVKGKKVDRVLTVTKKCFSTSLHPIIPTANKVDVYATAFPSLGRSSPSQDTEAFTLMHAERSEEVHRAIHSSLNSLEEYQSLDNLYASVLLSALQSTPIDSPRQSKNNNDREKREFLLNAGECVQTLREELPDFFEKGLTYDIYDEDIIFRDGVNHIRGLRIYKTLLWSIRFHCRMIFSEVVLDVKRICQPSPDRISVRWQIRGVPRIAGSEVFHFDGCSVYKLNAKGRIYEHQLDNIMRIDANAYLGISDLVPWWARVMLGRDLTPVPTVECSLASPSSISPPGSPFRNCGSYRRDNLLLVLTRYSCER